MMKTNFAIHPFENASLTERGWRWCILPSASEEPCAIGTEVLLGGERGMADGLRSAVYTGPLDVIHPALAERLKRQVGGAHRIGSLMLGKVLGTLADGSPVILQPRAHAVSHLKHDAVLRRLLPQALGHILPKQEDFFDAEHDFGEVVAQSECVPVIPGVDRVKYVLRNERASYIPVVEDREKEDTQHLAVVMRPIHSLQDEVDAAFRSYELFTTYTGRVSPPVPGASAAKNPAYSRTFWRNNALVDVPFGGQPYDPTTVRYDWPYPD